MSAMTELNVTPLMDLAFSLLIIFMISTPLLEQTIPINLPKQEENPSSARPEIEFQVISINAKGQIYWGKQPVDMVELNSLLESMSKMPNPPAISFRGDFSLPYRIEKFLNEGIEIKEPDLDEKIKMLKEHLSLEVQNMGEINGVKFMRKFYNYYISSTKNASKYRCALVRLESEKEILKVLDEILCLHNSNC